MIKRIASAVAPLLLLLPLGLSAQSVPPPQPDFQRTAQIRADSVVPPQGQSIRFDSVQWDLLRSGGEATARTTERGFPERYKLWLYPHPIEENAMAELPNPGPWRISIVDMNGHMARNWTVYGNRLSLERMGLQGGAYVLYLEGPLGEYITQKIVFQ